MRVIVVGGGEVGTHLAERLSLQGWDLVLIEVNPAVKAKAEGLLDVLALQGEGTDPEVLERAGVKETDIFISVTSSDEVNIVACQLARLYGVKECIARVNNEGLRRRDLHLAEHMGINMFIAPNRSVAEEVVRIVANPSATGVADFFDGELRLLAFELEDNAYAVGRSLKELRQAFLPRDFILAAVLREGKILVPEGGTILAGEDRLYLLGAPSDTNFIAEKFGARKVTGHNVVIIGGGRVGAEVARQISDFGFKVKIIEKSPERCKELAGQLPGVLVLEGDGVDSKLMIEENLGEADIFVCVTSDEATNLLSATIGKQMGAGKVIALIKRGDMFAPAGALGVDVAVNARLAVADRILRHLQRDRILSMFTFPGEDLEALEFVVKDRKEVTGIPIKELSLPGGVLIGAISRRGEVILPSGATKLQAGDRVILFARYADHKQMEALFLN